MIVAAFLVAFVVALAGIIGVRGPWWIKATLMCLVVVFTITLSRALDTYKGWPVHSPPKDSILVSTDVIEPSAGVRGIIYLWLVPQQGSNIPFHYVPQQGEPRAYMVPFTHQLEHRLTQAQGGDQGRQRGAVPGAVGVLFSHGKFYFHRFPLPALPPKHK